MSIFFTADTHFGHANVIKYAKRPFASAHDMNMELVRRWNEVVQPKDTVYHLGDVGLCPPNSLQRILERLNGTIHLVIGNHDKGIARVRDRFASVSPLVEIYIPDTDAARGNQHIVPGGTVPRCRCGLLGLHPGVLRGHPHPDVPEDLDAAVRRS
jgi:predicted phosphohydrolase